MNPNIALATWLWSYATYNDNIYDPNSLTDTKLYRLFDIFHGSRYVWCYALAPIIAGFFAGVIGMFHLSNINMGGKEIPTEREEII